MLYHRVFLVNFCLWTLATFYFSSYCTAAASDRAYSVHVWLFHTIIGYYIFSSLIYSTFWYVPNFTENKVLFSFSLILHGFPVGGRKYPMNLRRSCQKFQTECWKILIWTIIPSFFLCVELKYLELLRFEWSYSSLRVLAVIKPTYLKQTFFVQGYFKSQ